MRLRSGKICLALILAVLFVLPPALAQTGDSIWESFAPVRSTFILPASLRVVEDEAFEGTAESLVVLPDSLKTLRDRAFADNANLRAIYIPKGTNSIADTAFAGVKGLTIFGLAGSFAEEWAESRKIPFVPIDIWGFVQENQGRLKELDRARQDFFYRGDLPSAGQYTNRSLDDLGNSDPKNNPVMYPIDYDFP